MENNKIITGIDIGTTKVVAVIAEIIYEDKSTIDNNVKGVKILGATAHYVSSELDEGPIIEQSVERVDHSKSPRDLELIGRDLESITLAKAVKYHIERRIFINNSKTVIFN